MSLITPDFGLLFWMLVIFGLVFFLLWKFGFPIITSSVEKRNAKIERSLKDADALQVRMAEWEQEQAQMMEEARRQQAELLRQAADMKAGIVAEARTQAREEADKILSEARAQIAVEKENALRDVRQEIALLSVQVAEKILRDELSGTDAQRGYLDRMIDEAAQQSAHS